jgi:hypothetical protein
VVTTTGASAVLVYSLKDNSTVVGVLGGGINLGILNKELQSLNLTSLDDNICVIYVDGNGLEAADSDKNKSTTPESFANLNSFRNAIKIVGGRRLLPYCVYHS